MDSAKFVNLLERSVNAPSGSVQLADRLVDLGGWDSIGALTLIAGVDREFGVTLDVGGLVECQTVADLAALLEKSLASGGTAP